jgi:hypothetical protein
MEKKKNDEEKRKISEELYTLKKDFAKKIKKESKTNDKKILKMLKRVQSEN